MNRLTVFQLVAIAFLLSFIFALSFPEMGQWYEENPVELIGN